MRVLIGVLLALASLVAPLLTADAQAVSHPLANQSSHCIGPQSMPAPFQCTVAVTADDVSLTDSCILLENFSFLVSSGILAESEGDIVVHRGNQEVGTVYAVILVPVSAENGSASEMCLPYPDGSECVFTLSFVWRPDYVFSVSAGVRLSVCDGIVSVEPIAQDEPFDPAFLAVELAQNEVLPSGFGISSASSVLCPPPLTCESSGTDGGCPSEPPASDARAFVSEDIGLASTSISDSCQATHSEVDRDTTASFTVSQNSAQVAVNSASRAGSCETVLAGGSSVIGAPVRASAPDTGAVCPATVLPMPS